MLDLFTRAYNWLKKHTMRAFNWVWNVLTVLMFVSAIFTCAMLMVHIMANSLSLMFALVTLTVLLMAAQVIWESDVERLLKPIFLKFRHIFWPTGEPSEPGLKEADVEVV